MNRECVEKACEGKKIDYDGYIWRYLCRICPNERWTSVDCSGVQFWASTHGRIKLPSGKITRGNENNNGYLDFKTTKTSGDAKIRIMFLVHRFIMAAFHGPSELHVNHKNGIKTDNSLSNLEYTTLSGNMQHAVDTGLSNAKSVRQFLLNGDLIAEYISIREAAYENNISTTSIINACKGRQTTAGQFKWEYTNPDDVKSPDNDDEESIDLSDIPICLIQNMEKISCPVYQFDMKNKFVAKYKDVRDPARKYKLDPWSICRTCEGELKSCGNYIWRYVVLEIPQNNIICIDSFQPIDEKEDEDVKRLKHIKASQVPTRSIQSTATKI